jgi:hypothetical protein
MEPFQSRTPGGGIQEIIQDYDPTLPPAQAGLRLSLLQLFVGRVLGLD